MGLVTWSFRCCLPEISKQGCSRSQVAGGEAATRGNKRLRVPTRSVEWETMPAAETRQGLWTRRRAAAWAHEERGESRRYSHGEKSRK